MSSHSINSPSLFFHKLQLKHRHSLLVFDMLPQPPIYSKRSRIFALWLMFSSRAHLEILVSLRSVPFLMKNSIIFITKNKKTMQYIYKMVNCQTTKCHLSAFFGLIPGVPWRLHLPSWAARFSGGAMFNSDVARVFFGSLNWVDTSTGFHHELDQNCIQRSKVLFSQEQWNPLMWDKKSELCQWTSSSMT